MEKISADKLRLAADRLDPPLLPSPAIITDAERYALDAISELGGVIAVDRTYNGLAQIFSGPNNSFVLENEMGAGLRAKGLISAAGQITLIGFKALQSEDFKEHRPAAPDKDTRARAYREEVVR